MLQVLLLVSTEIGAQSRRDLSRIRNRFRNGIRNGIRNGKCCIPMWPRLLELELHWEEKGERGEKEEREWRGCSLQCDAGICLLSALKLLERYAGELRDGIRSHNGPGLSLTLQFGIGWVGWDGYGVDWVGWSGARMGVVDKAF